MANAKYWIVLFAVGEEFSGQCCVCTDHEDNVESIALPEIKNQVEKDAKIKKSHYDVDVDDIEIEEILSLEEWEEEFDEDFEESDLPDQGEALVFDFGD